MFAKCELQKLFSNMKSLTPIKIAIVSVIFKQGSFIAGVSNSVSYAGHIFNKKRLAGRIKRKNVSVGRNRRLKVS